MSDIDFIEAHSTDPVERAMAARVLGILHNPRLTSAQRRAQVAQAQRELLEHQRQRDAPARPASNAKRRHRGAAVDPIAARRRELGRGLGAKPGG
jgi:hypothetical protein